ncbi:MAG: DMT family transporter [Desulfovibrio sp.]|nr:DMT family transporter [Desulfovibrio sp.]
MRIFLLALLCMTLFASNSIFCRIALVRYGMDPLQYTAARGFSAVLALLALSWLHTASPHCKDMIWLKQTWAQGSWPAALALFAYMAFFSFAYVGMSAAMGTLIFNATIQATVLGWGVWHGTKLRTWQIVGMGIVMAGLCALVLPQVETAPPLGATLLGIGVGLSWGAYCILGLRVQDAVLATAGNFFRSLPLILLSGILALNTAFMTGGGVQLPALLHACCAGMLATGCGYVVWYLVVPRMSLVTSTVMQLSVPIITALLGVVFLSESITLHLVFCSACILGGIAIVVLGTGQR